MGGINKRMNGVGLSGTMVRLKAKSVAIENLDVAVRFTRCTSWFYRFMGRNVM